MPLTGKLGTSESRLGNIQLGNIGAPAGPNFDPDVVTGIDINQTLTVVKDSNIAVSNTLVLTQHAGQIEPLTPVVGYSGGQTRYAHVRDITDGFDLYNLDADTVYNFPASITKLMTALLIWEYKESVIDSETVTITTADITPPSGLTFSDGDYEDGDEITWEGLLTSIFVASASDACQAAARILGDEIAAAEGNTGNDGMVRFVERMNERAGELGMVDTVYFDPWGGSQTGVTIRNQTTARDISKICATTLSITEMQAMSANAEVVWPVDGANPRDLTWTNVNHFINGPTLNPSGIKDDATLAGKVGEWNADGATHLNLTQLYLAPNGNVIVITTFNAESYLSMTWDQQGIIYSLLRDFTYLTAGIPIANDPQFAAVEVLIGGDGSIVDESSNTRSFTNDSVTVGDPIIEASSGGLVFNSAFDNLEIPDSADLQIDSGDATLEMWYQAPSGGITSFPTEVAWFAKWDHIGNKREFFFNYFSGNFNLFASTNGTTDATFASTFSSLTTAQRNTFFNGAPRHIAIVKEGSEWAAYLNGERGGTTRSLATCADTTAPLSLGYWNDPSGNSPVGLIDDFRFTVGVARYSADKETIIARKFGRALGEDQEADNDLTLSQTLVLEKDQSFDIGHTLSLTQAAHKVQDVDGDNTLTLDQNVTFEKFKLASANNILVPAHTVAVEVSFGRTVSQGFPITHLAGRNIYRVVSANNTFSGNQLAVGIVTKPANNMLSLSQLAEAVISKTAQNFLPLEQVLEKEVTYHRNAADNYIPFQTIGRLLTIRRTVPQSLVFSQTLVGHVVKSAHNTLVLSQVVAVDKVIPAFNDLDLVNTLGLTRSVGVSASQLMLFGSLATVQLSKAVFATNAMGFNHFARGTRRLSATATNALTLAHALVREYKYGVATNTLSLDDTLVVSKLAPRTVHNTLVLHQTLVVAKTLVRSIVDTLTFHNSFEKYVGIGGHETVTVPALQVVKVKRLVILQSDTLVITLPAPEFNDSEGGTGRINIKRTMGGGRRVYARDNVTSKLNYQFIIDRKKAIELRNFIMNSNTKFLRMENWKGELWAVQMTNSPFSFGEDAAWLGSPGGNKSSITLEFEGVRLN